jgi:hypothetical protein
MRECLACSIGFWDKNFPRINRNSILANCPPLHEADGTLALVDQMERDFPSTSFLSPVLKVRCDAEWSIARHQIKKWKSLF